MKRSKIVLLVLLLVIAGTARLPAPIQEVPEGPTPAPEQPAKPKPKPKPSLQPKSEDARKQRNLVKPTPTPALLLAGTWVGTTGELRGRTVTINQTQRTAAIDGGPWGRESGNVEGNTGNQLVWFTTPLGVRVKWTFTLLADGKSAQLTNKHFLGSETGTFVKQP